MDNGQGATENAPGGVSEAARRVRTDFGALGGAINQRGRDVIEALSKIVAERPLQSVAIAFGLGTLLGGGLFSRATARLLGIGLRIGALALARDFLEQP